MRLPIPTISRSFLFLALGVVLVSSAWAAEPLRPQERSVIHYTHVGFWWPLFDKPLNGYSLQIVEDDGSNDPFDSDPDGVMTHDVDREEPRYVVTSGLEFGKSYAWRVLGYGSGNNPIQEGSVYHFSIAELPDNMPPLAVTQPEDGPIQPGITLFNVNSSDPLQIDGKLCFAVNQNGEVVFFYDRPELWVLRAVGYFELMPNGRLSMLRGRVQTESSFRGAFEETLDGGVLWATPDDPEINEHHDMSLMPSGDWLILLNKNYRLPEDEGAVRRGDILAVFDRHTKEITWSWESVDHFSLLDGFTSLLTWSHGNAAFYSPQDNSVYLSSRHLSRITRIDFDTGEIVFNMGTASPSGEDDFGDGLFSFPHAPEIQPNGNILLFDNANLTGRRSRAVELAFDDLAAPTNAEVVWSSDVVDEFGNPLFNPIVGDADRLPNGNTLVGACAVGTVYETTPDGRIVWKLQIGRGAPFEFCYRAQRADALIVDAPGDADGDWDLDLLDFANLQSAFTGPGPAGLDFPASISDFDEDDDVDTEDLFEFVNWMSGPAK